MHYGEDRNVGAASQFHFAPAEDFARRFDLCSFTDSHGLMAGRFLLVFFLQQCKLCVGSMLDCGYAIRRPFHGKQNLGQLELNCSRIPGLRMLNAGTP